MLYNMNAQALSGGVLPVSAVLTSNEIMLTIKPVSNNAACSIYCKSGKTQSFFGIFYRANTDLHMGVIH